MLALKWLNTALREMGGDPAIWERVGHVQLMMGDADAAAASFSKAVRGGTAGRLLARRCSALLAFANGDFPGGALMPKAKFNAASACAPPAWCVKASSLNFKFPLPRLARPKCLLLQTGSVQVLG